MPLLGGLALELKFLAPRGVRDGLGAYLLGPGLQFDATPQRSGLRPVLGKVHLLPGVTKSRERGIERSWGLV